jgi:hypothetical protein
VRTERATDRRDHGGWRQVLPARNADRPMSNNTMLFALHRLGYEGRMTGHGLRAAASSALNEAGFRPDLIERQLMHREANKVRSACRRPRSLPERREMMQQRADMVDACERGADVVPVKRRA